MAVYFQLFPIGYSTPASFQQVDNAICQNLDLPWDADRYACEWYDSIGLRIALGKSFQEIADEFKSALTDRPEQFREWYYNMLRINHYLLENYTTEAWFGR